MRRTLPLRLSRNPFLRLVECDFMADDAGIVAAGARIRCRISKRLTIVRAPWGQALNVGAIVIGILAYAAFAYGAWWAYCAFINFQ